MSERRKCLFTHAVYEKPNGEIVTVEFKDNGYPKDVIRASPRTRQPPTLIKVLYDGYVDGDAELHTLIVTFDRKILDEKYMFEEKKS